MPLVVHFVLKRGALAIMSFASTCFNGLDFAESRFKIVTILRNERGATEELSMLRKPMGIREL